MPPARLPDCLTCRPGQGSIPIYHFTHMRNVAGMADRGAILSDAACTAAGIGYARIGDAAIKSYRRRCKVRVAPFGRLGDYVPFYLAPRSPMLLRISSGLVEGFADGQDEVVYLVSSVAAVRAAGMACVFTDGQANHTHTRHMNDPDLLASCVDWGVMGGGTWKNTEADPQRMRRRQAEVLVRERFPWGLVQGAAARGSALASRLGDVLRSRGQTIPVVVRPGWYY